MVEKFESPLGWIDPAGALGDDGAAEQRRRDLERPPAEVIPADNEGLYPGDPARAIAMEAVKVVKRVSGT